MNDILRRIEELRKQEGISQYKLCKKIDIKQSTYNTWIQRDTSPKADNLVKIAEYFNVSTDYLMNGDTKDEWKPELTAKDEKDIKQAIEDFKNKLSTAGVMYDGEPLDDETKDAVLAAVELAERTARLAAKEKFTPKKYKK